MTGLRGRQVVVVGLGSSGVAASTVLIEEGARVRVTEARPRGEVESAAATAEGMGAEVRTGGHRSSDLDGAALVITSPGVAEDAEVLRWARDRGVEVWSELELGARLASCPYVAVTGTNGKTTTTEMVAAAMREGGVDAIVCGNVGYPFSLAATEDHEALVVEASSFQLRFNRSLHPRVSVLLNLAPDHLDWHRTMASYREAKRQVYARQGPDDAHVGNLDDPLAAAVSGAAPCPVTWFTLQEPPSGAVGYRDGILVVRLGEEVTLGGLEDEGVPHRANAAAAAAAAIRFGVDPEAVGGALSRFAPLDHRGATVAEASGVRFVDDSKATNPHAALAALRGRTDVVLVAGGRSKGVDLSPLAAAAPALAGAVVLGEAAEELERVLALRVPVRRAGSIEDAVVEAFALAPARGTVLLAPACASQDMFRDYRERGDRFAAAARSLARRVSAAAGGGVGSGA